MPNRVAWTMADGARFRVLPHVPAETPHEGVLRLPRQAKQLAPRLSTSSCANDHLERLLMAEAPLRADDAQSVDEVGLEDDRRRARAS